MIIADPCTARPSVAELERAFYRQLGRVEAASVEYRRAVQRYARATDDQAAEAFAASLRAGRVSARRRVALARLADALAGAR